MFGKMKIDLQNQLQEIRDAGLYKQERIIASSQGARIQVQSGQKVLNFCANNYLGLSGHPRVVAAAQKAMEQWGFGLSSVRFICGTQEIHKTLEAKVSQFLGTEDTILYAACFDANGGVFEPFFDKDCAIITDELNHASIIDGIRLAKAQRAIYKHCDMTDLENKLQEFAAAKYRIIATDGVFSMDGDIAPLQKICNLADKYDALVMVDDCHATGFMGKRGRGITEHCDVMGRVDLITTTFGKALGGASGGCVSGRKELIEFLRQKSRPYLFSNSLAPAITGATLAVLDMLSESTVLRDKLEENTTYFREKISGLGFDIKPGIHPIVAVMLYDEKKAHQMAERLLAEDIYVIGFSYPVVPRGLARIRVQISAAHEKADLDKLLQAFALVGREMQIIK
ncbi:MAG TPA: glycine C-acetyltransferase [bacterium]|nr:glycine C-acetyltransferase [bacterium]HPN43255.1 glycine C-acetyltransferase [bacterium]